MHRLVATQGREYFLRVEMFLVCFELDALLCGWGLGSVLVSSKVCTKSGVFLENIWNSLATSPELEKFGRGMVFQTATWG